MKSSNNLRQDAQEIKGLYLPLPLLPLFSRSVGSSNRRNQVYHPANNADQKTKEESNCGNPKRDTIGDVSELTNGEAC